MKKRPTRVIRIDPAECGRAPRPGPAPPATTRPGVEVKPAPHSPDTQNAIAEAAEALKRGELVAFPTETVYGLGANALDPSAVRRIFEAKGRPFADPLIVHISSRARLDPLVTSAPPSLDKLAQFWPGPLTVVLPRSELVPLEVTAGLSSVAIRVPAHPVARALLEAAAIPIAAPSANSFSRPSPTCAAHVLEDLDGRIDMLLNGGVTDHGIESTVVDLTGDVPKLLRPGAISVETLLEVLPDLQVPAPVLIGSETVALKSPGTQLKHYSPRARVLLFVEGGGTSRAQSLMQMRHQAEALLRRGNRVGVMLPEPDLESFRDINVVCAPLGRTGRLEEAAAELYRALRELDRQGMEFIATAGFTDDGLGRALQDRLLRAAEGRVMRAAEDRVVRAPKDRVVRVERVPDENPGDK